MSKMNRTLQVIKAGYHIENTRPVVDLFCREPEGSQKDDGVRVQVYGFRPYFYAPTTEVNELSGDDPIEDRYADITDSEGGYTTINEKPVTKLFTRFPRDVGNIRDDFEHYEADILFENRYVIDKEIKSGIELDLSGGEYDQLEGESLAGEVIQVEDEQVSPADTDIDPTVFTFDIEVDDRNGFPEAEDAEEEIVCISAHNSSTDEYTIWLYVAPDMHDSDSAADIDFQEYEPITDSFDVRLERFHDEEEMLRDFMSHVERTDPDVFTGWNFCSAEASSGFDFPYVVNRCWNLGLDPRRLARHHSQDPDFESGDDVGYIGPGGYSPDATGRVVMDLLNSYKRTLFTEEENYRLDDVGERKLGVGKERYPGKIGDLWERDPQQLLHYNLRDVEICVELNDQEDIINFWSEVSAFAGCGLSDAPIPGDVVDMYTLHGIDDLVLPSKPYGNSDEDYEGGAVFDPVKGLYENVAVLDLASLYPMSMLTMNASPETKVDPETYDGEMFRAPNGVYFRKEPAGLIKQLVDELIEERGSKKNFRSNAAEEFGTGSREYEKYDRQQGAVKRIMNSYYGVLGWTQFRLYDVDMGAAVTACGREVLNFTEEVVDRNGYEVLYGDTDSVMISLGSDVSKEEAIDVGMWLEEQINESYSEFAAEVLNATEDDRFELELEKLYRRYFQAGRKKRYAGHITWKEGLEVDDIDITGFEYKRSDTAALAKRVQKKTLGMAVRGHGIDEIREYLRDEWEALENGDLGWDEVGIPQGIGKELDNYKAPRANVKGAMLSNLILGTNYGDGSKPMFCYIGRVDASFWDRMDGQYATNYGGDPDNGNAYDLFKASIEDPSEDIGICYQYPDQVPEEFHYDVDKMGERLMENPIGRVIAALGMDWAEIRQGHQQSGLDQW